MARLLLGVLVARGGARPHAHAAPGHDSRQLYQGARCPRASRLERARGEPLRARPARVGLRRPRPLLDVPGPRRAGRRRGCPRRAPTSSACSTAWARRRTCAWPASFARAATSRWCRSCRPRRPAAEAGRPASGRAPRPGAGDRRALRRSPRLHAAGRAPAALRRRLLPQPLLRGGRHAPSSAAGGIVNQFTGRRRDGAVRRGRRTPTRRCRAGARGGRARMVARRRRAEPRPWGTSWNRRCASGSASTPGPPWSAAWATARPSISPRWATPCTWPARLEALTKDYECELVISNTVASPPGVATAGTRPSRPHAAQPSGAALRPCRQ